MSRQEFIPFDASGPSLGLILYTCPGWAVAADIRNPDQGFISVNIGGTPWLFSVFYGDNWTIDNRLAREKSFHNRRIKITERRNITFKSKKATSLVLESEEQIGRTYYLDDSGQVVDRPPYVEKTYAHYIFLKHRRKNLEIGYKLEEPLIDQYKPLVEEMLERIEFVDN